MTRVSRRYVAFIFLLGLAAFTFAPAPARAQTFALDPSSSSLTIIPATSSSLLAPALGSAMPGPVPPPVVGVTPARLGLLPGDVIDAISYGNDAVFGVGVSLYFTVSRASVGVAGGFTPNVFTEVGLAPPLTQPQASSDIFTSFDAASGVFAPFHTQIVDGDGGAPLAPLTAYTGRGLGLAELVSTPAPPFNDAIADFDWSAPGYARSSCAFLSLAPGSPSLTPGSNPLLMAGAEPGDILVSCAGPSPVFAVSIPAGALGLTSGGPGCSPPLCDDIDALALFGTPAISLAPGSPSLLTIPATPGDVIGVLPGPAVILPGFVFGLAAGDDIKGLEFVANPCPVAPALDADGDGVAIACPDNCPVTFNPAQNDLDFDGAGDECDLCTDSDADGFGNEGFPANLCATDLCPFTAGPNGDGDGDGIGDICDNCPLVANVAQTDTDFDGLGDACDPCTDVDSDGLGIVGDICGVDNCPLFFNPGQADGDLDTVGDACDNCPLAANPTQSDIDADTVGDACDNCASDANLTQMDTDADLVGDACDICTGGVTVTKPSIKFGKLGSPGLETMQIKGTGAFAGAVPLPPVDVSTLGMRVQVVDLGNNDSVVLDHVIPAGLVPTVCGASDGWKQNGSGTSEKYANLTNTVQPGCLAGSSEGITGAASKDKTAALKGVGHKIKAKGGTFDSPAIVGPLRVVVVYGGGAEEAAGQCSEVNFTPLQCVNGVTKFSCK